MNEEILFRSIYEHIKVPIFVINVKVAGDFIFSCVNPAFEKATSLRKGDVVGKRPEEIPGFSQGSFAMLRAHCERCLEGDEAVRFDWPFRGRGQRIWWLTQLAPVRDEAGKIVQIIGSSVNVTDLKRAEDALRESELRYREVFENISDCIFILDVTPDGRFKFAEFNPAEEKSVGYSTWEVSGKFIEEVVPAELAEQVTANYRRCLEAQTLISYDEELLLPVGCRFFHTVLIPVRNAAGNIYRIVGVARDITEGKRAEEALQESERRHRELFENSTDFVFTLDLKGRFTNVNKAAEDLTGYTKKELIGMSYKEYAPEDTHEKIFKAFNRVFIEGEPLKDFPLEVIIKDGTKRYFETCVSLLRKGEEIIGFQGSSRDVTERKQAEDALRHSEEEKTILNQIASIFLTVPDEAMYGEVLAVVVQVMKSTFGIFGYIAENGDLIVPSLTREIWNECQVPGKSLVFPSDSWGNSLWGKAIREKKAFCSDGPFRTPEGHIHIDHFLTVPIVYGQETIGLISVANKEGGYAEEDKDLLERIASRVSPILHARLQRDLQERRRVAAERDLKESEEKYRLLITNADEAIFIFQDEVVKFPNPKALEMIGYSAEELGEISFVDLIRPGDKDTVFERYLNLTEGERRLEVYPFRIIDKKGKEMWVQLTTAPIIWEKKPGILCFLRDVTEEKKLEAQFMQAQKMEAVGRLAGGVAHDFNNMLTVIIGHTGLALMQVALSDPLHAQLRAIDDAGRRSADLTRRLLAFARKQTIAPRIMNLNDTVSGMLKMLRRLIGEDIDLAWRPGAELWAVMMDPSQIDQLLANLCINARDAIAGVGKVTIETGNITFEEAYSASHAGFVPGEYVLLAVSDDGCGMDEETQAHLFEPFFTTKGMGQGTGLGLATVYGIVKQNDGFINVYSEPGQGTTFKIYFPRHKAEPAGTLVESAVETPLGGRETVLMVEDETAILDLGKSILEELGYTVLIAKTPGEAIRLVEEYTGDIHLLITDVVMPEMNGKDLARGLASVKPDLKCLYMSGYTANVIAHRGILDEGVHFIQKPFSLKDLAVKVRQVLDSWEGR